ncbi:MAG: putative dehydrogenase [Verrucomicrobiales bacterium]|jgi:predicted dehydrogenase
MSPSSFSNRRQFLKAGAGFAAGVSLPSAFGDHHEGKKLGYALVGLGGLSTNQIAPGLLATKHSRLAGIVTGTPEKEKIWAEKYNIPKKNIYNYENFDSIADNPDIDVIYIVLPNSMHKEFTVRAAKAGKHVLCEKPMATSAADCEVMIAACGEAKRKLAIGYRCQFEPNHQECMRLAQEKTFGDLKMIDAGFGFRIGNPDQWRLKHALAGGGGLMDVGIYALQACRYLTGEEPSIISATETKTDPVKFKEVDETIVWSMTFPSGVVANCNTTYNFNGINRFKALASKGYFGLEPGYSYKGIKGSSSKGPIALDEIDQFAAEMDDFSRCIIEDRESRVPGEEGLKDLRVVEAIYKSIRTGTPVKLG